MFSIPFVSGRGGLLCRRLINKWWLQKLITDFGSSIEAKSPKSIDSLIYKATTIHRCFIDREKVWWWESIGIAPHNIIHTIYIFTFYRYMPWRLCFHIIGCKMADDLQAFVSMKKIFNMMLIILILLSYH